MTNPDIPTDIQTLTTWADPGECEWMDGPSSYCVAHDANGRWSGYGSGSDTPCWGVDTREYAGRQALVRILTHLTQR